MIYSLTCFLAVVMSGMPVSADKVPSQSWMGMYFGRTKIGYARFAIAKSVYEGRPGFKLDSSMIANVLVLGAKVDQDVENTVYLDTKFTPVYQVFKMSSAGHTTTVTARYSEDQIVAELDAEGAKTSKIIPIPPGGRIVGDSVFPTGNSKVNVGDVFDLRAFNPLTLTLESIRNEALCHERIELGGMATDALVIKSTTSVGDITCWQDTNGEVLKAIVPMGISMIREPKEVALAVPQSHEQRNYYPPSDLAVKAAMTVGAKISDPRSVKYFKIQFKGITDRSLLIRDDRQKVSVYGRSPYTAEYEITASKIDPSKALDIPIQRDDVKEFLGESAYVQPSNPEIASLAREIAGSEKNSARIISSIRAWVQSNMQVQGDVGIVRSSLDVLHTKTGVCRDYAILYTALARSAGIPTKVVSGLVYWKGKLYYHAWAESFVGEWVPVDSTLDSDFVDATHVKFAEGDATSMFSIVKLMGSVDAIVLRFH